MRTSSRGIHQPVPAEPGRNRVRDRPGLILWSDVRRIPAMLDLEAGDVGGAPLDQRGADQDAGAVGVEGEEELEH
jgi:hypothetical protein